MSRGMKINKQNIIFDGIFEIKRCVGSAIFGALCGNLWKTAGFTQNEIYLWPKTTQASAKDHQ